MEPADLLVDLDDQQRRAVATEAQLVAVIAGAGSGKTRVLTRRVAYRALAGTADPRHTLVLTFTREAAGELRRRLVRLGLRERVEAGTFHSVMIGELRRHWEDRGRSVPAIVEDRRRLLAATADRRSIDEFVGEINWASARGVPPEGYVAAARAAGRRPSAGHTGVAAAYRAYREEKRRRGVIDLDDVLVLGADLLQHDAEFGDGLRWRFRHLLVDEAQDLNPLQHRVVDLLRAGNDDLFLVGDPAQAVYGFNGADPALLVDVDRRFPGIEIVRLPTNHRCTPQVVEAGAHVLAASGHDPSIESGRPGGRAVQVTGCADQDAEAQIVARRLRHLEPALVATGQVAVLARTHAQLAGLRTALEHEHVAVRRQADGPGSPYRGAIAVVARLGSAARLRAWAHDVLDDPDSVPDGLEPESASEVASAVLDFLREQPLGDGAAFRAWVATSDPFGIRGDTGVDLLTFHGAKGREWHTVFVTGVETGLVPHRSATTIAARAEEARLLYVALTRATDVLEVTWAARRGGYQRRISPLLDGYVPAGEEVSPPPPDLLPANRVSPREPESLTALTAWRDHAARAAGILPESLLSDAVLRQVALDPPASPDELAASTGIGLITARRLFDGLEAALADQSRRSTTTGA